VGYAALNALVSGLSLGAKPTDLLCAFHTPPDAAFVTRVKLFVAGGAAKSNFAHRSQMLHSSHRLTMSGGIHSQKRRSHEGIPGFYAR